MIWTFLATLAWSATTSWAATRAPSGCVAFDINWNLLAFGFNGKDYNAGTQDTWTSSGAPTDITTTGRPPFNQANTTCYLSQFTNAIYVMNADSANPSNIYIYDATAKSWSTQQTTTNGFDPSNFAAILDHDTNVFYSYSAGEIFSLDMGLLKSANSTPIQWVDVQNPGFPVYQPVMALAQNHIHFLGVPGVPAGSAKIFVIHFSFMQPEPQSFGEFPGTHGKTASFFLDSGVQQEFAFVPDDGSATYVINVETNTTKTLTGPPEQDPLATYYASTSALVQLTSDGKVTFLAYDPDTTTSGGTWATISKLPTALFNPPSANPLSNSGTAGSSTGSNVNGTKKTTPNASGALNVPVRASALWSVLSAAAGLTIATALL